MLSDLRPQWAHPSMKVGVSDKVINSAVQNKSISILIAADCSDKDMLALSRLVNMRRLVVESVR